MSLYFNMLLLAFTTLLSLPLKLLTETWSFSCGILAQAFFGDTFKTFNGVMCFSTGFSL